MKKILAFIVIFLVAAEGFGYWFYKKQQKIVDQKQANEVNQIQEKEIKIEDKKLSEYESFPATSVEEVDGTLQRVIHMGVRKWQWDPAEIEANYGEKVILILHNADITHSFSIPELNIKQEIPEEGAVVMFEANKRGNFEFSCDVATTHQEMKGRIKIK